MIDETDRQILSILQQNARTSNAEIARQVSMAPSAVLERIRRLESRGVIQGYEARISPEALGLDVLAFVFVRSTDFDGEARTAEVLASIPEVLEAHHIAGEDCFLLKVHAATIPGTIRSAAPILASVTVSMGDERIGTCMPMRAVSRV